MTIRLLILCPQEAEKRAKHCGRAKKEGEEGRGEGEMSQGRGCCSVPKRRDLRRPREQRTRDDKRGQGSGARETRVTQGRGERSHLTTGQLSTGSTTGRQSNNGRHAPVNIWEVSVNLMSVITINNREQFSRVRKKNEGCDAEVNK